jgi:hypothetical protein
MQAKQEQKRQHTPNHSHDFFFGPCKGICYQAYEEEHDFAKRKTLEFAVHDGRGYDA